MPGHHVIYYDTQRFSFHSLIVFTNKEFNTDNGIFCYENFGSAKLCVFMTMWKIHLVCVYTFLNTVSSKETMSTFESIIIIFSKISMKFLVQTWTDYKLFCTYFQVHRTRLTELVLFRRSEKKHFSKMDTYLPF